MELELGFDRIVATVATAARRATAANPVTVRCFVMGTSVPPPTDGSKGTEQRFKGRNERGRQLRRPYFGGLPRFAKEIPSASAALRSSRPFSRLHSSLVRSALTEPPPRLHQLQRPSHVWSRYRALGLRIETALGCRRALMVSARYITPIIVAKATKTAMVASMVCSSDYSGSTEELASQSKVPDSKGTTPKIVKGPLTIPLNGKGPVPRGGEGISKPLGLAMQHKNGPRVQLCRARCSWVRLPNHIVKVGHN